MLDGALKQAYDLVNQWGHDPDTLDTIRLVLVQAYVPTMSALLALTAASLLMARTAVASRLRAISLRAWVAALVLFNAALAVRLFWTPHMPQVYLDEISFLNTADNMTRTGLNQLSTVDGPPGDFFHQCPAAWQYLISCAYGIFGIRADVAFTVGSVFSSLSVVLAFVAVTEMTGRARIGLWAALFLATLPVHVRLGGSTALETPSVFFLFATLCAMQVWRATLSRGALLLTACCAAWFANCRMENSFALGPLLLVWFVIITPRGAWRTHRFALAACAAIVAVFSAPALLANYYGVATRFYFFYQAPEATRANILSNWQGNLPYWFDDMFHPLLLTLLALVGVVASLVGRTQRRVSLFWLMWTLVLIVFYTMNPSCDFALRHTLDSWRTAIHPALGVILLAALGADAVVGVLSTTVFRRLATAVLVVTACLFPFLFRDFIQQRHIWMIQWETMVAMREHLPPDAHLLVYDHSTVLSPSSPGLAYEMALTTGVVPHYFVFPETYDPKEPGPPPQIVYDVDAWKVEKRKLFLYHLDAGTAQDKRDLSLMQALFRLRPVAGTSMRRLRASFSLWRIEDSAKGLVAEPAAVVSHKSGAPTARP